tara:strand:+ start:8974 stop:9711 length:738 start_codon:yes stop_codon:yes gene_type:complete
MGSSRFPGKPLKNILGIPMIGHVYKRSCLANTTDLVYVATCDKQIFDYVESIGGKAVMTSDKHERCTDRTAEAVERIEKETNTKFDIILMIQGDEPMVTPGMIDSSLKGIIERQANVVNLVVKIKNKEEFLDPNEVKVVLDIQKKALYFSREPIPSVKKFSGKADWFKQVCVIPFKRDYLFKFNSMKPTPLEEVESVDMLRILEHGESVDCIEINENIYSVDTKEDLEKVESLMSDDILLSTYID